MPVLLASFIVRLFTVLPLGPATGHKGTIYCTVKSVDIYIYKHYLKSDHIQMWCYLYIISSFNYYDFIYNNIVFNYNNILFILRIIYFTIFNYILNNIYIVHCIYTYKYIYDIVYLNV